MTIFEGESVTGFVSSMFPNNMMNEHCNAVTDWGPPVQERSHQIQSNFETKTVSGKFSTLQESSPVLNSGSAEENPIFHHTDLLDVLGLVELNDLGGGLSVPVVERLCDVDLLDSD